MAEGFKIVERAPWIWKSFWADGKATTEYRPKQWSQPPKWLSKNGYFLTFFDNLNSVLSILNAFGSCPTGYMKPIQRRKNGSASEWETYNMEVSFSGHTLEAWRCEVENVCEKLPIYAHPSYLFNGELVFDFGKNWKYLRGWEFGTRMAKRIKLVEKILLKEIQST